MKTWDRALVFWGLGALLAEAALEWSLVDMAIRVSNPPPPSVWVWLFPLVLFPVLLAVAVVNLLQEKSRKQQVLLLKYLTLFLPWFAAGGAAAHLGWRWQLIVQLGSLPLMIWVPFWYSRNVKAVQQEEAGLVGA